MFCFSASSNQSQLFSDIFEFEKNAHQIYEDALNELNINIAKAGTKALTKLIKASQENKDLKILPQTKEIENILKNSTQISYTKADGIQIEIKKVTPDQAKNMYLETCIEHLKEGDFPSALNLALSIESEYIQSKVLFDLHSYCLKIDCESSAQKFAEALTKEAQKLFRSLAFVQLVYHRIEKDDLDGIENLVQHITSRMDKDITLIDLVEILAEKKQIARSYSFASKISHPANRSIAYCRLLEF